MNNPRGHALGLGLMLLSIIVNTTASSAREGVRNKCPKNCYPMLIMRVVDGDTVQGYIHTSDDVAVIYAKLRLDGIDTPESRANKAQCMEERLLGLLAKSYLTKQLDPIIRERSANRACACDTYGGKFAKRRIGILKTKKPGGKRWTSIIPPLKSSCFAVDYTGKGKKTNWCNCLKSGNCPTTVFSRKCIKRFSGKGK